MGGRRTTHSCASPPLLYTSSTFLGLTWGPRVQLFIPLHSFFPQIHFEHIYVQGSLRSGEDIKISQQTGFLPSGVYDLVEWGRMNQIKKKKKCTPNCVKFCAVEPNPKRGLASPAKNVFVYLETPGPTGD